MAGPPDSGLQVGDRRSYARSDLFERRRRLMDRWAAYLSRERVNVVRLHA